MIPAIYYYDIYIILVLFLTFFAVRKYSGMKYDETVSNSTYAHIGFLVCLFFIFFIGMRPISEVFVDMTQYQGIFDRWVGQFFFDWDAQNLIYGNLMNYLASIQFPPVMFYLIVAAFYFGCAYYACKRLFPNDFYIAFIVFLGAFSTFSYGTNGIKAGWAMSVFVLALSYYRQWKVFVPLVLISYGIHHSMQLPIGAILLAYFYRNTKIYLYIWIVCVLISAAQITVFQELFASLSADQLGDERGGSYLSIDSEGFRTGFRFDFILYSAAPVWIGWIAIKKKMIQSEFYSFFLNTYLIINSIWMLCMYASFTNRIAYLAWGLYPFVLIYPLLKEDWGADRYKLFVRVVLCHFGFTFAMHYIYYVFMR